MFEIKFDSCDKVKPIVGFGASMTESSAFNISQMGQEKRSEILKALFSPQISPYNANINLIRLCIGASDFSLTRYDYQENENAPFTIEHEKKYLIPILREALSINKDLKFFATPWSAPNWMKNGKNLNSHYYATYANYLKNYILAMQIEGIQISYLSIQNEPLCYKREYPTMEMSAEECVAFLPYLIKSFKSSQLTTKIIIYDHNYVENNEKGIDYVEYVYNKIKDIDPGYFNHIDGSAWHYYGGEPDVLKDLIQEYPTKRIFFTERTTQYKSNEDMYGKSSGYLDYLFFRVLKYEAVCALAWNIALDKNSGPCLSDPEHQVGLIEIDHHLHNNDFKRVSSFLSVQYYSQNIPIGATKLQVISLDENLPVSLLAFKRGNDIFLLAREGAPNQKIQVNLFNKSRELTLSGEGKICCVLSDVIPSSYYSLNELDFDKFSKVIKEIGHYDLPERAKKILIESLNGSKSEINLSGIALDSLQQKEYLLKGLFYVTSINKNITKFDLGGTYICENIFLTKLLADMLSKEQITNCTLYTCLINTVEKMSILSNAIIRNRALRSLNLIDNSLLENHDKNKNIDEDLERARLLYNACHLHDALENIWITYSFDNNIKCYELLLKLYNNKQALIQDRQKILGTHTILGIWNECKEDSNKTISFKTNDNQHFLSIKSQNNFQLHASSTNISTREKFKLKFFQDDIVALQTCENTFVCAEKGGGDVINANRTEIDNWEKFKITFFHDGSISLQTYNGTFFKAINAGGQEVKADAKDPGNWEKFTMV